MRVALVSCVKTKRSTPHPAKELYTSPLFLGLRQYAETHSEAWFILSAKYGLVDPERVLAPYEQTLNKMSVYERRRWAEDVKGELARVLPPGAEVIVLAGERYRENLLPFLEERGHPVTVPLEGMPFGRQLQFLHGGSPAPMVGERKTPWPPEGGHPSRVGVPRAPIRMSTPHPVLSDLTSRKAVLAAIAEFDRIGRDAFLEKYGYGVARRYFLEHEARHYDSKAIVGVAYGYQYPGRGPLENTEFSGGHQTVQRKLEELGFSVSVVDPEGASVMMASGCPFCPPDPDRVFYRGETVFALWDAYPVNPGHALIIPNRHVGSWFEATEKEQAELFHAVSAVREEIEASRSPDGYNIGINDGFAAGQTVGHLHLHVIPRYQGDVADPRGGIRWVIPDRAPYWDDE